MTIAEKKKKENIAEYLLFLWQMEDLVRAANFDLSVIRSFLSNEIEADALDNELNWFGSLIRAMQSSGVQQKGHVEEVNEILIELNYLHHTLLNILHHDQFAKVWNAAELNLREFLEMSGNKSMNPVEACLTALYGLMMLRLKKQEVSEETMKAMDTFRNYISMLSEQYRIMRSGDLFSIN